MNELILLILVYDMFYSKFKLEYRIKNSVFTI